MEFFQKIDCGMKLSICCKMSNNIHTYLSWTDLSICISFFHVIISALPLFGVRRPVRVRGHAGLARRDPLRPHQVQLRVLRQEVQEVSKTATQSRQFVFDIISLKSFQEGQAWLPPVLAHRRAPLPLRPMPPHLRQEVKIAGWICKKLLVSLIGC